MIPDSPDAVDRAIVAAQVGRPPRDPFRIAVACSFGYPALIVSPPLLDDGTRFPTWAWLSCPHLVGAVAALESDGGAATWAARAATDPDLARALARVDAAVRAARVREGGGTDACAEVGIAGQRDPLGIKCLHAHVAYQLAGLDDPIGSATIARIGRECEDEQCATLVPRGGDLA